MGDIDTSKIDAEAFQKFVLKHRIEFDEVSGCVRVRIYSKLNEHDEVEVVRVAGGKLDGTETQFTLFMQIVTRELYHHWRRTKTRTQLSPSARGL